MGLCPSSLKQDRKIYQEVNRDRSQSMQSKGSTTQRQTVTTEREKQKGSNIPNVNSKEKIGYLNLDSKTKAQSNSSVNRPKSHSVDCQRTEIKEVKVMHSTGKRHTLAHISVCDKQSSWGGSVPSFFTTTNQELDIDDSLTPGKRRDSRGAPHEFQVSGSVTEQHVGNWEDQFNRRALPKIAPRPKIGSVRVEPLPVVRE